MLFDSHCHLDFPEFAVGISSHLDQAQLKGVTDILVPGVTANDWFRVIDTCQLSHPIQRHLALGLHPCFLQQHNVEQDLLTLETHLKQRDDIVAIGECGLDLFIEEPQLDTQQTLFDAQLELSAAYKDQWFDTQPGHNIPLSRVLNLSSHFSYIYKIILHLGSV
jgi:TatD DNase family protein